MPPIVKLINILCLALGGPYFISMLVYPFYIGDWAHVHAVWETWQSLNTGALAFVASVVALNAVKYSEEKKRQRNFIAARAFLPQALSELCGYFEESSKVLIEAWERAKDRNDRCKTPLNAMLPSVPEVHIQVFKECIAEAEPKVGDHLAYILVRLQIHQSRLKSLHSDFSEDSYMIQIPQNIMSYIFALAELQGLVNQLFPYSRGVETFSRSNLKAEVYFSAYRSWDIYIEDQDDLRGFTERNHAKRWDNT
ncbi:hypothetical protein [Shewanella violacea]|uniref:Uncharacterized protein n=1 Tax=Shewanella violacea (strain JCM 10179 / CIP 106290 / LMG 19151 / DSS12) TaxID=637905 RepID=D4ZCM5_SHEVD|nr:hypothetical protein [Shewanella violacea]BAJ03770.1 hypothetical protein SVI_3799 [Shewanella violacea DSS12]